MENPLLKIGAAAMDAIAEGAEEIRNWANFWKHAWAPPVVGFHEFDELGMVGIDFSTSICKVSSHVINGYQRFIDQVGAVGEQRKIWPFGVNSTPFALTKVPIPGSSLRPLEERNFNYASADSKGYVEAGSAFNDYFMVATRYALRA